MAVCQPGLDLQEHEDRLDGAGQPLADLHDFGSMLFDVHGHLDDLVVGVVQQEVEVVQWRRILVLETVQ